VCDVCVVVCYVCGVCVMCGVCSVVYVMWCVWYVFISVIGEQRLVLQQQCRMHELETAHRASGHSAHKGQSTVLPRARGGAILLRVPESGMRALAVIARLLFLKA